MPSTFGGVKVPIPSSGARQSAAARNLGAPKGVTKAPAPKTAKTIVRTAPKAPPKATKAAVSRPAAPRKSGGGESLNLVELSPAQTAHRALKGAQATEKAESEPYQRLLSEIHGQEGTASKAEAGYGATAQNTLASIQAGQEASAKTFENQAAENALQQGKAIETSGQNQATLTGGYIAPELKAQLNAEGQQAKEAGAAGNSFAQNSAQAGGNLIAGLRAAAVQRNQEGLTRGIPNAFAKEAEKVNEKLGTVVGKVASNSVKNREALEKQQYNERATNEKLQHEGVKLSQEGEYKKGEIATKAQTNQVNAQGKAEANTTNKQKIGSTRESAAEANATKVRVAKINAAAKGSTLSPSARNKLSEELGRAYNSVEKFRSGKAKLSDQAIREAVTTGRYKEGYTNTKGQKATRTGYLGKSVGNQVLVTAALELWNTHAISAGTRDALSKLGYNPGNDAEIFQAVAG